MSTVQTITAKVSCIKKTPRFDPHDRIRAIGGVNADGSRWELTQDQAIAGIQSGKYTFYVQQPGYQRVEIIVAVSASGRKYLKTKADGEQPNNLLALPECP